MNFNYDYIAKVVLCGDTGSGKSSLMMTYDNEPFNQESMSTIGVDFKIKYTRKNDLDLMVQIHDTAGQQRFKSIVTSYFRGASGILLVFDLTDADSLYRCEEWMKDVTRMAPTDTPVILIGNKSDLKSRRVVQEEQAREIAQKLGVDEYWETSAKTGENVKEAFDKALDYILSKQTLQPKLKLSDESRVRLGQIADPREDTTRRRSAFARLLGCNIL